MEILKWLSTVDPSIDLNKAEKTHKPGTGEWLFGSQEYFQWVYGNTPSMWLYEFVSQSHARRDLAYDISTAGSGKTIITSTIISELNQLRGHRGLAYFFFNFSDLHK